MKTLKKLLVALLVAVFAFSFVSCKKKTTKTQTLGAPVVELNGDSITWAAVSNAQSYDIYNGTTKLGTVAGLSADLSTYGLADGTYDITVVAVASGYNASAASNAVSYKYSSFNPVGLDTILGTYKNNQDVQLEEVVFAVTSEGFFVSSSVGSIYVNKASLPTASVAVGDKVRVSGKFGYASNFPQIKSLTQADVVSSGNAIAQQPVVMTLEEVVALDYTLKTSYAKLVSVTGFVSVSGTSVSIRSEAGTTVPFNSMSNTSVLEAFDTKMVTLNAIVFKYTDSWSLVFTGAATDVVETKLTQTQVEDYAKEDIEARLDTKCYEALSLPSKHSKMETIVYSWSSEDPLIAISNNKATVAAVTQETDVTISVKVTYQDIEVNLSYTVKSCPVVEQTIEEFRNNEPTSNGTKVKLTGTVVSFVNNESGSIKGVILATNGKSIEVDFYSSTNAKGALTYDSSEFKALELGDNITVTASYRTRLSQDRPTVEYPMTLTVNSKNNELQYGFEDAFVLKDAASYKQLADDVSSFAGKLVKIENPWMCTSSSSGAGNYTRFGYAEAHCAGDYGADTRIFSILNASADSNIGTSLWRTLLSLPYNGSETHYEGLSIYAYVTFMGNTVLQFTIPSVECIVSEDVNYAATLELTLGLETKPFSGATIALPEKVLGETITWTEATGAIDVTTGKCVAESTTTVTLVASFTKGEQPYNVSIEITIVALPSEAQTITSLLANPQEDTPVRVKGTVIAFNCDGNTTESRNGIIIMDDNGAVLYVDGIGSLYSKTFPSYIDKDGEEIKIGDVVEILGIYQSTSVTNVTQTGRHHIKLTGVDFDCSVDHLTETASQFNDANVVKVTNNDELVALFGENYANYYGKVIKITGTAENPIYVGCSSNSFPTNVKVYMNSEATDAASAKVDGSHWIALKSNINHVNLWAKFWEDLGIVTAKSSNDTTLPVVGDMYVVIGNVTSTYFQMMAVNAEAFTAHAQDLSKIASKVVAEVEAEIEPGTITLPTTAELWNGHEVALTWSCESEFVAITGNSMVVTAPAKNTEISLVASFTEGVEYQATKTVLIKVAEKVAINLTDLSTKTVGDAVYVQGVVMGLGRNNDATIYTILKDAFTNKMMIVTGLGNGEKAAPTMNGLAVGDAIAIDCTYTSAELLTFTGDDTKLADAKVTIENVVTTLDKTDKNIVTVDDQDKLASLVGGGVYNVVVKLVDVKAIYYDTSAAGRVHRIFFTATKLDEQKINKLSPVVWEPLTNCSHDKAMGEGNAIFGTASKAYATPEQFLGDLYVVFIKSNSTSYYQFGVIDYVAK